MQISKLTSQNSMSAYTRQSQAVTSAAQDVTRAKSEAQKAPSTVRGKYQEAYVQATKEASSAESSRLQQRSYAVKQVTAQTVSAVAESTRDLTTVISSLITQPLQGNRTVQLGQFLDRYA